MNELQSIRAFVAVVEAGNFSKAARHLGTTQSSASRLVAMLEDHLGTRLLTRSTRRLSLTEAGQLYYERVSGLLAEFDEAGQRVRDASVQPRGVLRVAAPLAFGKREIAPLLADFHALYPDIMIGLFLSDTPMDLVGEGYDVAIRFGQITDSSLIARSLAVSRSVVCCSPKYLETHARPQAPADLKDHACLTFRQSQGANLWRFSGRGGTCAVDASGPLFSDTADVLLEAALAGLGIVQLPEWMVGPEIQRGRLEQLVQDWKIEPEETGISAIYPEKRKLASKVRVFVDFLKETYETRYWAKA